MALSHQPHVMVLDLVMPGVDGFEVFHWVKAEPRLAGMAVVVLNGHLDAAKRERLFALGAKACLDKPVSPELLYTTILPFLPQGQVAVQR